jgi:hypothetical protein
MWLLVALLVVSIIVTVVARGRGRDHRDSVGVQQRQLEALRIATSAPRTEPVTREPPPLPVRGLGPERRRAPKVNVRWLVIGGAVVVVLALVGVAVALGLGSDTGSDGKHEAVSPKHSSTTTTDPPSTTTTTVPPAASITGTEGGTVTISVPASPYQVTIAARSDCWMQAVQADQTVVVTTTLQAGESKDLTQSGPLTIRLGNPGGVDVSVNGQAMTLPASGGSAMKLQLNPAT